jgi:modulator of FtsH protease
MTNGGYMLDTRPTAITYGQESALEVNKVLRNTYALLSLTLLFSAITAGVSMALNLPHPGLLITMVGYFGLLFLTQYLRNSAWGILSVFALTGFMGLTLGPIVNAYLSTENGGQIVMNALGGTAITFLGLSGYALTTKKNFSFLGNFLFVGILVAFLAGLASIFLQMPALSLAVSAMFILLMSGVILFETSNIIHGGQTNYIMATVSLYVAIYNLFLSLLQILGVMGGDD